MTVTVRVLYKNNTYTAKVGKTQVTWALSTDSAQQAVERLAVKLYGELQRVNMAFVERIDHDGHEVWTISPDLGQRCRICGCNWEKGCPPRGCYWVEDDLCSCCASTQPADDKPVFRFLDGAAP